MEHYDSKIVKCPSQAFLSILIITSSKRKEGKFNIGILNLDFHLYRECYKLATSLLSNYNLLQKEVI